MARAKIGNVHCKSKYPEIKCCQRAIAKFREKFHLCTMKLFLIDGHALIFKMYYAFLGRPMVNSKGVDTSILFGFTKYLLELVEREKPTHLAVSFDPPGGTFRNKLYPEYKANRAETPQLVIDALEPLTAIVRSMDIPVLMVSGFEADDVIGTVAKRFASDKMDVYMVTPDKDYGQLVSAHIFQYKPGKSGSENEILDSAAVCEKWKISSTSQVRDILTLCGDSSDNVPGVQGIGPVGAAKLLSKYGTTEGIYSHISELTARQQDMLNAAKPHIALSEELVTIRTDVPVDVDVERMAFRPCCAPGLSELLDKYEMPSLKKLISRIAAASGQTVPAEPAAVTLEVEIVSPEVLSSLAKAGSRMSVMATGGTVYAAAGEKCSAGAPEEFKGVLGDSSVVKAGADIKSAMNALAASGTGLEGRLEDVELMHYLLNPERNHSLDALALSYLGVDLDAGEEAEASLFDEPSVESSDRRHKEAMVALKLAGRLDREIDSVPGLRELYDRIEEPLIGVLSRMERAGVKVDLESLSGFAAMLRSKIAEREAQVRELAGEPGLNVGSPKQLGVVLFEKMALDPKARKPRSGNWSTDEQTLQALSGRSPIIEAILDYRAMRKLLSTYIEPFAGYISPVDGRVHTTFNQTMTATGRLSSSNPNLQNIPVRTDLGREIRRAFVAGSPDSVMMSADYSQIELRLMAHFSGDSHLVEAFRAGQDIHAATASKIFGIGLDEVTPDQRRVAKTVNFGIMYGISAFGLSQRLGCSRQEAKKIIDDYFTSFPSIRRYIDNTLDSARKNGYVETLFGRRRYLPDINSGNATVRAFAERNAVNAPVQGTAADIIKLAMIGVDRQLREGGYKSMMVLQIHDELLLEVPSAEIETVKAMLVSQMENVVSLSVPLTVECNYGKNWLDAH